MKKLIVLLLLGAAILYLNSDNFTSRLTQALNESSNASSRDERLQERLASIDELRALEEKVEQLNVQEEAKLTPSIASGTKEKPSSDIQAIPFEVAVKMQKEEPTVDLGTAEEGEIFVAQNEEDKLSQTKEQTKVAGIPLSELLKAEEPQTNKLVTAKSAHNEKADAEDKEHFSAGETKNTRVVEVEAIAPMVEESTETNLSKVNTVEIQQPVKVAEVEEKYEVKNLPYTKIYTPVIKVAKEPGIPVKPAPMQAAKGKKATVAKVSPIPEFARHEHVPVVESVHVARLSSKQKPVKVAVVKPVPKGEKTWYVKVKKGDTLSQIARRYYGDPAMYQALIAANRDKVKNAQYIYPGQIIKVPSLKRVASAVRPPVATVSRTFRTSRPMSSREALSQIARVKTVVVQPGDTLSKIAERYIGDTDAYKTLYSINRSAISNPDLIYPGQRIRIPAG